MPNTFDDTPSSAASLPPSGDQAKADKYLSEITSLLKNGHLMAIATDLSEMGNTSLVSHYQIDVDQFRIEFGHSKPQDNSTDAYLLVFNHLEKDISGEIKKTVLAYINLNESQFSNLKTIADTQIAKVKKETEEKRFSEAMAPIDEILNRLSAPAQQVGNATPPTSPSNHTFENDSNSQAELANNKPQPTWSPQNTPLPQLPLSNNSPAPFQTIVPIDNLPAATPVNTPPVSNQTANNSYSFSNFPLPNAIEQ